MTLKLDFEKIEFQNKGIFLISLENVTKCWIFCTKWAKANFLQKKNEKPLQFAYFIILMRTKDSFFHQRGDMQNLQSMTFNSFILNMY